MRCEEYQPLWTRAPNLPGCRWNSRPLLALWSVRKPGGSSWQFFRSRKPTKR